MIETASRVSRLRSNRGALSILEGRCGDMLSARAMLAPSLQRLWWHI